ncbi:FixH family protein [Galbibacter orientalis]|uniref:FixH protein n=1 Tax=Galbibacter orientalis DSM 19592 TaxID=926559 RepID=I3C5C0_9FLAO|nr:FixH family protein [Galbibacter orientalis]EIJ38813.1 FixH protein [Galbibacter orientalis DSM 19592]|tara:strand:+ start:76 stop:522 length:447 start_codon:yes stop_codon:yes gene_type:complete
MKFNWGTGIIIAFVLFISFIMYFVIKMNTNKIYDHDLVTKDYYKKELEYQSKINKAQKAKEKGFQLNVENIAEGLLITFPSEINVEEVTGEVFLYRPSNKKLDFNTILKLTNSTFLIPEEKLPSGRWNIEVDWSYHNEGFYYKKELSL